MPGEAADGRAVEAGLSYKAGVTKRREEIELWLAEGGRVVAVSERAARALRQEYAQRQIAAGRKGWEEPAIGSWAGLVDEGWQREADGRLLLNATQERALWAEIVGRERGLAARLEPARQRIAALAMEAHGRLCAYAPEFLRAGSRRGWSQDAALFSRWLEAFDERCRAEGWLSTARWPLEWREKLEEPGRAAGWSERPGLLLVGFDRLTGPQRELCAAWGRWQEAKAGVRAGAVRYYAAASEAEEIGACARWAQLRLAENPAAQLLVVAQAGGEARGAIERAFLELTAPGGEPLFEFSLGQPLGRMGLARAALLLLGWLGGERTEAELDWLFGSGYAAGGEERTGLCATMSELRRRGRAQTGWRLEEFLAEGRRHGGGLLPEGWAERLEAARAWVETLDRQRRAPGEWAATVGELLNWLRLGGGQGYSSVEFQQLRGWSRAVECAASLGFDGRRVSWAEFVAALGGELAGQLFAPESRQAPVLIAGAAESAGLEVDGIWVLGAGENGWPAVGQAHPLLPLELQRSAGMPHGSAELDERLAEVVAGRLLASAPELSFSFARQSAEGEQDCSRLVEALAGKPEPLPELLRALEPAGERTEAFVDDSRIPFTGNRAVGGSAVLEAQSECPFQAFATVRLGARNWQPAEAGLNALERGELVHGALCAIWSGGAEGLTGLDDLAQVKDLAGFAAEHARRAVARFRAQHPERARRLARRHLELEVERLSRLLAEWLAGERRRVAFTVEATERKRAVAVGGLELNLRLDRVDRLADGTKLIVDYKTGTVSPGEWDGERPEEPQLPLYAGFALDEGEELGGVVYGKLRAGEVGFAGRVFAAETTLEVGLAPGNALRRRPLTVEALMDWREALEALAAEFLAGRAEVAPRRRPQSCLSCRLEGLCRVGEQELEECEDEDDSPEGADE